MKFWRLVIPALAGMLLAGSTLAAMASGRPAQPNVIGLVARETDLLPFSEAEDLHADASGKLWISESTSGTVRQLDPVTGVFTLYTGLDSPSDAQLGPDGKLWFANDNSAILERMDLASRVVTTWTAPSTSADNGIVFDSYGRVWFIDDGGSGINRFDPNSKQMCNIPLPPIATPGGGQQLAAGGGAVWLADEVNAGLGRITDTLAVSPTYTFWPLAFGGGSPSPLGLALAPNGEVWWADSGLGKIGRLRPASNSATLFGPPGLSQPVQVAYHAGKVWFTDPYTDTLGVIDPAVAVGLGPTALSPIVSLLNPICHGAGNGLTFTAGISTGVAGFSPVVYPATVDAEGTLYGAPPSGFPVGLTFVGFNLWATDIGRDRLVGIDTAAAHLFLPLVRR